MSCTKYKSAVDAAKEAVIHGLNTNEETNTLAELWRHYLGLRHIADNHKHVEVNDTISFSSSFYAPEEYGSWGAAQPVDYGYGLGEDVISFGDTVITGGEGSDTIKLG
tara:strand:- start:300 stop:623 length:324 start_codon:yes stop_codon:yes gene_type:complete